MTTGDYLVNYGVSSHLGRFTNPSGHAYAHGDAVVVESPRGLESAVVLAEHRGQFEKIPSGQIVRSLTVEDREHLKDQANRRGDLLAAAEQATPGLVLVDLEILLDDTEAILHAIPLSDDDVTPILDALSATHQIPFRLLDLRQKPIVEEAGCGKPGCGSSKGGCTSCSTSGGGCSTGSCSKNEAKSAAELGARFVELRQQMEAAGARVALH